MEKERQELVRFVETVVFQFDLSLTCDFGAAWKRTLELRLDILCAT